MLNLWVCFYKRRKIMTELLSTLPQTDCVKRLCFLLDCDAVHIVLKLSSIAQICFGSPRPFLPVFFPSAVRLMFLFGYCWSVHEPHSPSLSVFVIQRAFIWSFVHFEKSSEAQALTSFVNSSGISPRVNVWHRSTLGVNFNPILWRSPSIMVCLDCRPQKECLF